MKRAWELLFYLCVAILKWYAAHTSTIFSTTASTDLSSNYHHIFRLRQVITQSEVNDWKFAVQQPDEHEYYWIVSRMLLPMRSH